MVTSKCQNLIIFIMVASSALCAGDWNKSQRFDAMTRLLEANKVLFDVYIQGTDGEKVGFQSLSLGTFNPYFNQLLFSDSFAPCSELSLDLSEENLKRFRLYVYGGYHGAIFDGLKIDELLPLLKFGHFMDSSKIMSFISEYIIDSQEADDEEIDEMLDIAQKYQNEVLLKHALKLLATRDDLLVKQVWDDLYDKIGHTDLFNTVFEHAKSCSDEYFKNRILKEEVLFSKNDRNSYIFDRRQSIKPIFSALNRFEFYKLSGNIVKVTVHPNVVRYFLIDWESEDIFIPLKHSSDGWKAITHNPRDGTVVGLHQGKIKAMVIDQDFNLSTIKELDIPFEVSVSIEDIKQNAEGHLIACGRSRDFIWLGNIETDECQKFPRGEFSSMKYPLLELSTNAQWLVANNCRELALFGLANEKISKILLNDSNTGIAVATNLVAIARNELIEIYDLETMEIIDKIFLGYKWDKICLSFSDNDDQITIIAGKNFYDQDLRGQQGFKTMGHEILVFRRSLSDLSQGY